MELAQSCKMLLRRPSVFLHIVWARLQGILMVIWSGCGKYLRLLAFQALLVPVAVFLKVTGRLKETPADAITITNSYDIIRLGIVGMLIVITIPIIVLLSMVCWGSWREFSLFEAARKTFLDAKQEWPWCEVSNAIEERSSYEEHQYSYEPVNKGDIRLLKVFRAGKKAQFIGELVHVPLEKGDVKYLAISYTWDDLNDYSKVYLGNKGFLNITKSVYIILDTLLAPKDRCIHLWIDGLCINQKDVDEKSTQVMLMRKIYSHAQQVIICLGGPTLSSDQGMDSIATLHKAFTKISRGPYGSSQVSEFRSEELANAGFDLPKGSWIGLTELLSRRWWNRVWVIQEAAVGANPILICGDRAVRWDVMAFVILMILTEGTLMHILTRNPADPNSPLTQPVKAATHLTQISSVRIQLLSKKLPSFQDTLMEMVGYDATDERDRVYALLGISLDQEDVGLIPNYKLSTKEVYISTARHLLMLKNSLLILHRAGIKLPLNASEESPPSEEDLPSWVPDWQPRPASEDGLCFGKGWAKYRASGTYKPYITSPSKSPFEKILIVRGVIVDFVQQVSKLKSEQERILAASKELYTKAQPTTKPSDTRLFDLEDERKITTHWVSEHQQMMLGLRIANKSDHVPWKGEYERTILATDPCVFSRTPVGSEFNRIWMSAAYLHLGKMEMQIPYPKGLQAVEEATLFHQRFMTASMGRRFFTTRKGCVGLGGQCVAPGDVVVIFLGASTPFIVREASAADGGGEARIKQYRLIGEAYVDGLMAGEGVEELQKGTVTANDIRLR